MTTEQITTLEQMADDLSAMADAAYDDDNDYRGNPSASLRSASYRVRDAVEELRKKTALAVGEMVQAAAHSQGVVGPMPYRVLREKQI